MSCPRLRAGALCSCVSFPLARTELTKAQTLSDAISSRIQERLGFLFEFQYIVLAAFHTAASKWLQTFEQPARVFALQSLVLRLFRKTAVSGIIVSECRHSSGVSVILFPVMWIFLAHRLRSPARSSNMVFAALVSFCRASSFFFCFSVAALASCQALLGLCHLSGHSFQTLLFSLYLELCHCQMFLGAATLSTLYIGISGSPHEIEKVILQDTVG